MDTLTARSGKSGTNNRQ